MNIGATSLWSQILLWLRIHKLSGAMISGMGNSTPHFLIVEDNDDHAHLLLRNLKKTNPSYTASIAADGSAALGYLRSQEPDRFPRPDVILLDLNLPKVNGIEVLSAVKEDADLRTIPVVILTTSDAERDRSMAYARRANSYLVKPTDFEAFQQLVRDLGTYWGKWNRRAST